VIILEINEIIKQILPIVKDKRIIYVNGTKGSGRATISNALSNKLNNSVIIDKDIVRYNIRGTYRAGDEEYEEEVNTLFLNKIIEEYNNDDNDYIIIPHNQKIKEQRKIITDFFKDKSDCVIAIYLNYSLNEILKHITNDNKDVNKNYKHYDKMIYVYKAIDYNKTKEDLTLDEGFSSIINITDNKIEIVKE